MLNLTLKQNTVVLIIDKIFRQCGYKAGRGLAWVVMIPKERATKQAPKKAVLFLGCRLGLFGSISWNRGTRSSNPPTSRRTLWYTLNLLLLAATLLDSSNYGDPRLARGDGDTAYSCHANSCLVFMLSNTQIPVTTGPTCRIHQVTHFPCRLPRASLMLTRGCRTKAPYALINRNET